MFGVIKRHFTNIYSLARKTICLVLACKRDCRLRLYTSPHPGIHDKAEGTAAIQAQSIDKGFDRFVRHFKTERPVASTFRVQEGLQSEM
jgi:hypothetical protein